MGGTSTSTSEAQSAYEGLSKSDRRLVDVYLRCGMVQRTAYFEAIYSGDKVGPNWDSIDQLASRKFRDAKVQAAIEERLAEEAMSAAEVLARLTQQGRSLQMQYLQADGSVDLERLIADGFAHLIKGTKFDRSGNLVVEFYDAQAALKLLGQARGTFGPKGTEDDPVITEVRITVRESAEETP